jgi:hypothetical protein
LSFGVSADGLGNVYISGSVSRSLEEPDASDVDAFVSKYASDGTLQWMQQFGTSEEDASLGVSADGFGNVYVSGYTFGSLAAPHAGDHDAFISKFDSEGTLQWTTQFRSVEYDLSNGVSADGLGRVYLTGFTTGSLGGPHAGGYDAFIAVVPEPAGWLLALIATSIPFVKPQ